MSLWQFTAAIDGYNRVHGSEAGSVEAPNSEEFYDMVYRLGTVDEPAKIQ